MNQTTTRPARGRPPDLAKRRHIVETAARLFCELGPDAVTIEGVAQAAGVSKVTVYNHFGDKVRLFTEVIVQRTETIRLAVESLDARSTDVRQGLLDFGVSLLTFLSSDDVVAMERLLVSQGPNHPEITEAFFEAGPRAMCQRLADVMQRWVDNGKLALDDPSFAAQALCMQWKGMAHLALLMGTRPPPGEAEIRERVTQAVDMFLRAYAPRSS